jgi:hypothetical protein
MRDSGTGVDSLYNREALETFLQENHLTNDRIQHRSIADIFGFVDPSLEAWITIIASHRLAEVSEYEGAAMYRSKGRKCDHGIHLIPCDPSPQDRNVLEMTVILAHILKVAPFAVIASLAQYCRAFGTLDLKNLDFRTMFEVLDKSRINVEFHESYVRNIPHSAPSYNGYTDFGEGSIKFSEDAGISVRSQHHLITISSAPDSQGINRFSIKHRHQISKRVDSAGSSIIEHVLVNPNPPELTVEAKVVSRLKPKRFNVF